MKKINASILTPEIESVINWHFQILGKQLTEQELKVFFQVIVTDNALFPLHEHIEVVLKSFFSAIHYGNAELKGTNIRSHSVLINEWLKNRSTIKPVNKKQEVMDKSDDWVYDPNETLPLDISTGKAKDLLYTIQSIYGSDKQRILNSDNFMHYIDKLKLRAKGLA
jgi:hypothetical protein